MSWQWFPSVLREPFFDFAQQCHLFPPTVPQRCPVLLTDVPDCFLQKKPLWYPAPPPPLTQPAHLPRGLPHHGLAHPSHSHALGALGSDTPGSTDGPQESRSQVPSPVAETLALPFCHWMFKFKVSEEHQGFTKDFLIITQPSPAVRWQRHASWVNLGFPTKQLQEILKDTEVWCAVHGVTKSRTWLSDWTETRKLGCRLAMFWVNLLGTFLPSLQSEAQYCREVLFLKTW